MAKLQFSQDHFFITLPAKIVRALKWQKGDKIEMELDPKGRIYLENKS